MKYTTLEEIAKDHKDWVNLVSTWVDDYAEDIVQEMYLKIYKLNKPEVNRSYVYLTLRSITLNRFYNENKTHKVRLEDCKTLVQVDNNHEKEAYNKVFNKVIQESNNWEFFDRNLFLLYFFTKLSMRDIEKKKGVGRTTIHHTIKCCKERIKNEVGEDWEDYCNEDFELL